MPEKIAKESILKIAAFAVYLIMISVAVFVIMVNDEGTISPVQEFFMTTLLAVGCGGLLATFGDDLGIEVIAKYKARGAIGVMLLIYAFAPASNSRQVKKLENNSDRKEQTQKAKRPDSSESARVNHAVLLASVLAVRKPELPAARYVAFPPSDTTRIKIIYPIGVDKLNNLAWKLKRQLNRFDRSYDVRVFSSGTWRTAIINRFKSFSNSARVTVAPTDGALANRIVKELRKKKKLKNVNINRVQNCKTQSFDVIIELGI